MSSSVFYKFKNSKELTRVQFDGTDITVFDLKREIIIATGLSKNTEVNLHIYPEHDLEHEYDDDTTAIPRSSTVVAVRRPAPRGHGRASRYVTGKAPVRAIKKESRPVPVPVTSGASSTLDAEAAFLAEQAQVWEDEKEKLSKGERVNFKKDNVKVPTGPLPNGYVCRRCNIKGHWIQACPTNADPNYKPAYQISRTTGIPRSFLKKVEKPLDEEAAKGVRLDADGEYVQVMTDTRAWEKFQEKTNAVKAQQANADAASKEVRERGLECSIDNCMFVDPVKTPCCSFTYCRKCIENALEEGDLVCPNCKEEEVLMDDLVTDDDMEANIRAYLAEKAKEKMEAAKQHQNEQIASDTAKSTDNSAATAVDDANSPHSKKRKSPPIEIQPPTAPKAMRQPTEAQMHAEVLAQMDQMFQMPMPMPSMQMPMNMPMQQMGMPMPNQMMNMGMGGFPNGMANGNGMAIGNGNNWGAQGFQNFTQQNMNGNMNFQQSNQNDAYERQPVNNRNRGKRTREPDYRTLH